MKHRISNPFVTRGYVEPKYFCDRQDETARLISAIKSKRNITLISSRRMGKTGLLKHVTHKLEKQKPGPAVIYADLMPTVNGQDLLNSLSSALLAVRKDEKNFFEKILTVLSSLRPKLTYDSLTGQPSLELNIANSSDVQAGLSSLLNFIVEIRQDLVIMLDEFQQISLYPEKNMEQVLRSIIQSCPTIPFIFSGSGRHVLEQMFSAANRPFYQSAELFYLHEIPDAVYKEFISEKFAEAKRHISQEALSVILKWTRSHTFYVQHVCNLLFETYHDMIDESFVRKVFYQVLSSYEPLYSGYKKLIPPHQYKLLQAIAETEDGIDQPTSGSFIKNHNLVSPSSVNTSLKALAEKDLIIQRDGRWLVYDVFFSRWLEYQHKK